MNVQTGKVIKIGDFLGNQLVACWCMSVRDVPKDSTLSQTITSSISYLCHCGSVNTWKWATFWNYLQDFVPCRIVIMKVGNITKDYRRNYKKDLHRYLFIFAKLRVDQNQICYCYISPVSIVTTQSIPPISFILHMCKNAIYGIFFSLHPIILP